MELVTVYCPICNNKKLLRVSPMARGKIYPWCKMCHDEVEVDLDKVNNPLEPRAN